ncbi:MAG: hypothetical protein FP826_12340 [Sphingomonadales bacterium]|nr:hypothetical protein [Sphingomonadales bacterium]MBU3991049.1 hypothetical protein [Alphaproteobacteria bacterium]
MAKRATAESGRISIVSVGGSSELAQDHKGGQPTFSRLDSIKQRNFVVAQELKSQLIDAIDSLLLNSSQPAHLFHENNDDTHLRTFAKRLYDSRRRRNKHLPVGFLGEPAWDILLDLFISGPDQIVKSVCVAADVPYSTAWRWIATLEAKKLVCKSSGDFDGRHTYLSLTPEGKSAVAAALNDMLELIG